MKPKPVKSLRRDRLLSTLARHFEGDDQAYSLVEEFLGNETFNKAFCTKLIEVARSASWELRRLAVLMLEHQVLKISARSLNDFDFILTELKLKLSSSLLKEGYTTTNLRKFIPEFRRKLQRHDHVHAKIEGWRTSNAALEDFLELSRSDCKLSLARYLFTAHEVAEKILFEHELFGHQRTLLQVSVGPMPHAQVLRAIELFGTKVAPIVRKALGGDRPRMADAPRMRE